MPMLSNVQLRTSIRIQRKVSGRKPGEITGNIEWIDIGNASSSDPPRYIRCQWVGAHGDETFSDEALQGTHFATELHARYLADNAPEEVLGNLYYSEKDPSHIGRYGDDSLFVE